DGYTLSLRSDRGTGGIQALQHLGLLDRALAVSVTGIGSDDDDGVAGFTVWDTAWNELLKVRPRVLPGLPVAGMRIARRALRDVLIEAVEAEGEIRWGVACTGVERLADGRARVRLSDGGVQECDVVIAADGASSKIRAAVRPGDGLRFAGPVCLSGTARFSEGAVPQPMDRCWGIVLGEGGGKSLFVSPVDERSALWSLSYLALGPREAKKPPLSEEESKEVCREALEIGRVFTEPFQTLVLATDPSTVMVFNAMDKQPFTNAERGCRDDRVPVVFIGDSNHAVSPFAGNGANLAMMDGWDLAEQLCKSSSLHAALTSYDKLSVPRAKSTVKTSHVTIAVAHSQGWKLFFYVLLLRLLRLIFFR
ncbi:FAD/NAD(P)-binding domain-containing protein, partial [Glonium stellatum]